MNGPAVAPVSLAAAHARLLQDRSIQFAFDAAPPPPTTPEWMKALGRWLMAAAPAMKWVMWGLLALGALLILALLARELLLYRFPQLRKRTRRAKGVVLQDDGWRPSGAKARALLEDADRLAAEGRYAEAAHVLLHRSVDDIEGRRPDLVRPSLTSRDIAALPPLAAPVREAFSRIAAAVERGLFAGRPLAAEEWTAARAAYAALIVPDAWAGRGA